MDMHLAGMSILIYLPTAIPPLDASGQDSAEGGPYGSAQGIS